LVLFVTLMLTCMGLGSVTAIYFGFVVFDIPFEAAAGILTNPQPENAEALIWMNNISQLFGFALPVMLFFPVFGGKNIHHLLLKPGGLLMVLTPLLIFFANGIIDLSGQFNKWLIPANSWLENQIKPTEDLMEKMTGLFIGNDAMVPPLLAFISIAVVPAICEELVFRGVLQPLFAKITRNIHVAIWLTAILFSLIHMQFYGFLPRIIMGALLGYMVVWSGTLWAAIIAHFFNNAFAFLMFRHYGSAEMPEDSIANDLYFYVVSTMVFIILLRYYLKNSKWPWLSFEYLGVTNQPSVGISKSDYNDSGNGGTTV